MPTAFLDNKSSHFFIFNPWIRLQLNCPCATFFLLAVILRFLSCHVTLFMPIFRFCVPLKILESLWFLVFLEGVEWSIGHIWADHWWFHLVDDVTNLCQLEIPGSMWLSGAFGGYGMGTLTRHGSQSFS